VQFPCDTQEKNCLETFVSTPNQVESAEGYNNKMSNSCTNVQSNNYSILCNLLAVPVPSRAPRPNSG